MYGHVREKSVNSVRSIMLRKMIGEDETLTTRSKVDLSRLPPCRDNLIPHIHRVNHRLAIYKRAATPIYWCPKPYEPNQGWEKNEEGTWNQCGPVAQSSPLHWLTCWRKQLRRWMGKKMKNNILIMKTWMRNEDHCLWHLCTYIFNHMSVCFILFFASVNAWPCNAKLICLCISSFHFI